MFGWIWIWRKRERGRDLFYSKGGVWDTEWRWKACWRGNVKNEEFQCRGAADILKTLFFFTKF